MVVLNIQNINSELVQKFLNSNLGISLFNTLFTAILGFITFKIYQRYKNKKDNNLLYIQVIKLKSELLNNLDKLKNIELEYERLQEMHFQFKNEQSLIEQVEQLNIFACEVPIRDNKGNQVDVEYDYENIPYDTIRLIGYDISNMKYEEDYYGCENDIKEMEESIRKLRKNSLIEELINLQKKVEEHQVKNELNLAGFNYLKEKLIKFNKLEEGDKIKNLDKFCKYILNKSNPISDLIKQHYEYKKVNKKYNNLEQKLEINFILWFELEIELIAVYDSQKYLFLDELYTNYKKVIINISEIEEVKYYFNEFNERIFPILDDIETRIKKVISKTNWLFKDV